MWGRAPEGPPGPRRGPARAWREPRGPGVRIRGRDQAAFAKGAFLGCGAAPHTGVAVGAGGGRTRPGCGLAETEGASLRRGVLDRGSG